jgi:hypothetical protein
VIPFLADIAISDPNNEMSKRLFMRLENSGSKEALEAIKRILKNSKLMESRKPHCTRSATQ